MNNSKPLRSPEEETELLKELFGLEIERAEEERASRDPNRSMKERDQRYTKSVKLKAQFDRLAKKAEGEIFPRNKAKGEAYSLADYYLNQYPDGSFKITKYGVPSMMSFARYLINRDLDNRVSTCSGKLEVELVGNFSITMALNGKATKVYTLQQLNIGFKRAKAARKN